MNSGKNANGEGANRKSKIVNTLSDSLYFFIG